jgi:hypothetical protein
MNVSQEDARESLKMIKATSNHTRKVVASTYASGLLILWGLIWVVGFMSVHFYPRRAGYIFNALNTVGIIATILICTKWPRKAATKTSASQNIFWRFLGLWFLLFAFASLWLLLLRPSQGVQVCAFLCTVAMFGYVVIGLWFGSYFMVWLGLIVTGLTFLGYHVFPGYFYLWMSPMGGGALLATGIYIRLRWR